MSNIQNSILTNNNFIVTLNLSVFSFSKVTNITGKIETEAFEEGGYNESPRIFKKQKTSLDTLVLEKGIQTSGNDSSIKIGTPINAGAILVVHNGNISKVYGFEYGLITKWEIGELNALSSDILIRRVEISHTGLVEYK